MKKIFFTTVFLCSLALSGCHKNLNAKLDLCPSLNGTWSGEYYDVNHLVANGGPWPLKMSLHYHQGEVVGQVISGRYGIGHMIWGKCANNKLTDLYFLHSVDDCGVASTGIITDKKHLQLTIPYEDGMIKTKLQAKLKHINYHYDTSHSKKAIILPQQPEKCHPSFELKK